LEKELAGTRIEVAAGFAQRGPLRLLFQDAARCGRISDCRRCCCRRPQRPMVKRVLSRQYMHSLGAVSPQDGQFDSLGLPQVDTPCIHLSLEEAATRHADDNIVMVFDGAGWHTSNALHPPATMRLLFLPPYSPELDPVEHLWDGLREWRFHKRVFDSLDAVEDHLVSSLHNFERDRACIRSITAWRWIADDVSNANWNQA
jgi:transposase